MPLEVTSPQREFTFKKNGNLITLADPDPSLTPEEVLQSYGSQYPELTTATVEPAKLIGDKTVYNAKTTVGTKA